MLFRRTTAMLCALMALALAARGATDGEIPFCSVPEHTDATNLPTSTRAWLREGDLVAVDGSGSQ